MKKMFGLLFLTGMLSCTTGSPDADGGYTGDSTAGNNNSVSHQPDSAGVGKMYPDSSGVTRDSARKDHTSLPQRP